MVDGLVLAYMDEGQSVRKRNEGNTKVLGLDNWVLALFSEEHHRIIDFSFFVGSKWGC